MMRRIGCGQVVAPVPGVVLGIAATGMGGAWAGRPADPLRPVEVTLHRFDLRDGTDPALRKWLA